MVEWRNGWLWGSLAAAGALAGAGLFAQQRFKRQIENDPEREALSAELGGRELRITSADGTVLNAKAFGPEDATPVVLSHGWTENLNFWTYQIQALADLGLRVVAFDHRGHGDSEAPEDEDYSIERFGEDLEAVLEHCVADGERAVTAGHSLGAMAIAAWARDHEVKRRVGAAALINTGVGDLVAEQLLFPLPKVAQALNHTLAVHGFLGSRAPLPRFSTPLTAAFIRYVAFGPAATPAQVAFFERMVIANPPDVRATVGMALSELELYDALPRLTVPTVVVAGEKDRLTPPSHARRIADELPQLERLIILPDTGHMAPIERHQEVVDVLRSLAERVAREAGAIPA
jgi:pimeloyl-ACP methyl ester carboxylesterase